MMRGACLTYSYNKDEKLYNILKNTVEAMMNTADENGRISSYKADKEFDGWDMWARKYVLLGMQYFIEICNDKAFIDKIIKSMCGQVDYIISKIGKEEGKMAIYETTSKRIWRGLSASTILEPVVRLYNLTGEKKYLDFATYIAGEGCIDVENLFELAYENGLYPYQYSVTKAYEMISCFEGLVEYYRATGIEKYKTAAINFANKVLESDFTIVGSSGCTHELFDHSMVRRANRNDYVAQETCVTVTLMKFMYQLTLLTGDSKYVDAFELSLYNAYLGSLNTENKIGRYTGKEDYIPAPLPFDSYSPLVADIRGKDIGGFKVLSDKTFYGCCACIGSAGVGLIPKMVLLTTEKGIALNLFENGTYESTSPAGNKVTFNIKSAYPADGKMTVSINIENPESFQLLIRNPEWSENTSVLLNGEIVTVSKGYITLEKNWTKDDIIEVEFDMRTHSIRPTPYGSEVLMVKVHGYPDDEWYIIPQYDEEDPIAKYHIALQRGPIILAQENRLGYSVDKPVDVKITETGSVEVVIPENKISPYKCMVEVQVPLTDGSYMTVTDYASAGKLWNEESKMAAWMLTKN